MRRAPPKLSQLQQYRLAPEGQCPLALAPRRGVRRENSVAVRNIRVTPTVAAVASARKADVPGRDIAEGPERSRFGGNTTPHTASGHWGRRPEALKDTFSGGCKGKGRVAEERPRHDDIVWAVLRGDR